MRADASKFRQGMVAGDSTLILVVGITKAMLWAYRNVVTPDPVQAFINWGTAERVYHYTAFEMMYDLFAVFFLLFILSSIIFFMAYGPRL